MDYACPYCRELLRTDPASGQPPPMCPRCGGDIAVGAARAPAPAQPHVEPAPANAARRAPSAPSLATFLQSTPPKAAATADEMPRPRADARGPDLEKDGMPASVPTLEDDGITDTSDCADVEPGDAVHPDAGAASTARRRAEEIDAAADDLSFDGTALTAATGVDSIEDQALPTQDDALALATATVPAAPTVHEAAGTPSFTQPARERAVSPRAARWQWVVLALLALTLALQVLLADRARLAADAQWRPLLTSLCGALGCSLPTWHEPDAFTMLSRDVRPVPGSNGALLVQATFRNDARWSQAWPVMRLSLSDADGRIVGARAFVPSEYLDGEATASLLAPGQSAQIMLQVREPEASVVAFSFDFD